MCDTKTKELALILADSLNASRRDGNVNSKILLKNRGWSQKPKNRFSPPTDKEESIWIEKALKQERRKDLNSLLENILGEGWEKLPYSKENS